MGCGHSRSCKEQKLFFQNCSQKGMRWIGYADLNVLKSHHADQMRKKLPGSTWPERHKLAPHAGVGLVHEGKNFL